LDYNDTTITVAYIKITESEEGMSKESKDRGGLQFIIN